MKTLAILFFMINLLKKYHEGIAATDGQTWGLTPTELAKNVAVIILVLFSTEVLAVLDSILVSIEFQYRYTAPALLPLQLQDLDLEQDIGAIEAAKKAMAILYEALVTPLYGLKMLAFIAAVVLWLLDIFISALMAMRHPKSIVLSGALSALVVMTVRGTSAFCNSSLADKIAPHFSLDHFCLWLCCFIRGRVKDGY